jgi:hypothetical protein
LIPRAVSAEAETEKSTTSVNIRYRPMPELHEAMNEKAVVVMLF